MQTFLKTNIIDVRVIGVLGLCYQSQLANGWDLVLGFALHPVVLYLNAK